MRQHHRRQQLEQKYGRLWLRTWHIRTCGKLYARDLTKVWHGVRKLHYMQADKGDDSANMYLHETKAADMRIKYINDKMKRIQPSCGHHAMILKEAHASLVEAQDYNHASVSEYCSRPMSLNCFCDPCCFLHKLNSCPRPHTMMPGDIYACTLSVCMVAVPNNIYLCGGVEMHNFRGMEKYRFTDYVPGNFEEFMGGRPQRLLCTRQRFELFMGFSFADMVSMSALGNKMDNMLMYIVASGHRFVGIKNLLESQHVVNRWKKHEGNVCFARLQELARACKMHVPRFCILSEPFLSKFGANAYSLDNVFDHGMTRILKYTQTTSTSLELQLQLASLRHHSKVCGNDLLKIYHRKPKDYICALTIFPATVISHIMTFL
jgi:hypothetical protein